MRNAVIKLEEKTLLCFDWSCFITLSYFCLTFVNCQFVSNPAFCSLMGIVKKDDTSM